MELGWAEAAGRGEEHLEAEQLYHLAASTLLRAGVPFLVGGSYALGFYTPLGRKTKDFDVFVRPAHVAWALRALAAGGFTTDLPFPHWLGKALHGERFIDVIFGSGNGVAMVDDEWFEHSVAAQIFGLPLRLCPPEEMIWSKSFVCERERFDGADVLHIVRDCGAELDWERLLRRFGAHWRVLYAHLVFYGFAYPALPQAVPGWVSKELAARMANEPPPPTERPAVCRGTLLSREQYLVDLEQLGYRDGRLDDPVVRMTAEDVARWTAAIPGRNHKNGRKNCGLDPRGRR
jgi:hypothetical protein